MRNAGLEETQTGIKIAGRNINNLRYADDTTLLAESEEAFSQSYGFSSSDVQMWELDHKEGWAPKNWCFRIFTGED